MLIYPINITSIISILKILEYDTVRIACRAWRIARSRAIPTTFVLFCAFLKILLFSFLARSWEGAVKNCILNIILSYNSRSDQIEQEQYCTKKNKIKHSIKDG